MGLGSRGPRVGLVSLGNAGSCRTVKAELWVTLGFHGASSPMPHCTLRGMPAGVDAAEMAASFSERLASS